MAINITSEGLSSEFNVVDLGYISYSSRYTITTSVPIGGCIHFELNNTTSDKALEVIFQSGSWSVHSSTYESASSAYPVNLETTTAASIAVFYVHEDEDLGYTGTPKYVNAYAWRTK